MGRQEHFDAGRGTGYFHGTNAELDPGEHLLPGAQITDGYDDPVDNHGLGDNRHVYLTDDPHTAALYGKNVYEVQHHGLVDPKKPYKLLHPEYATPRATVVRKVRGDG